MASQALRLATGGRIDRSRLLHFTFDGRRLTGHPGDTLASALLANGVHFVGRSFKYHRPRGIVTAGSEEPSALVQLGTGAWTQPNTRATEVELFDGLEASSQNRWPSLGFDVGAVNNALAPFLPAGFYYKTFMWPRRGWKVYEHFIRLAAGLGRAPEWPDPDRYERRHLHCDVLVVGGGPAGLAAALTAGRTGARVVLVDEQVHFGGQLLGNRYEIDGRPALDWVRDAVAELATMPEVRLLKRTTLFGYYNYNFLAAIERVGDHRRPDAAARTPRQRLWKIRAQQVVLATGAIERPLVFPDNDRPGTIFASAARTYVNRFGVVPGSRAVVFANNDDAYRTVRDLTAAGVTVAAVVDIRANPDGPLPRTVRADGIEVLAGHTVVATHGKKRIKGIEVQPVDAQGLPRRVRRITCDLLCTSGGWTPTTHLFSQSGGRLGYDAVLAAFVPIMSVQPERSAGACKGSFRLETCLAEGFAAGAAAAQAAGFGDGALPRLPAALEPDESPMQAAWRAPHLVERKGHAKAFIDLMNDVTVADIQVSVSEGYRSVEHVKRYTTVGMGTDQGKTSNLNALAILADIRERPIPEVGTTKFRPPYIPVTMGALGGRDVGALVDPVRRTPIHEWHERNGALFENVGQWKRPWYYPRPGERMREAVAREVKAARTGIGILDASTLGKIDIQGRDAAEFLDRVYTNDFLKLPVGRCRYGLMLNQDGMVMDDGVTARLGVDHFYMTTTTGNAARVLAWLEEWLQTEWPDLRVYCTSVTEQYAKVGIVGPKSRELLRSLTTDIDVDKERLPFMGVRDGHVADIPARVFRVSYTGEISFEIAVPADDGLALWTALFEAGQTLGITPYGTEAMHVLRAEKGYIIVGQETDGTVTPIDLGLDWLVSKSKQFIGRRSLSRPDSVRPDRKQLVGIFTEDPEEVLPEGAQIVAEPRSAPPMVIVGHVTSSYWSPNVGRSIAMALVKGGRGLLGQTLFVPLEGQTLKVTVTEPRFFDKEGVRLNG